MDLRNHDLAHAAFQWTNAEDPMPLSPEQSCETRDVLGARIDRLRTTLVRKGLNEEFSFLLHAVLSEIGGNSFDHNIGQWRDVSGVFFAYALLNETAIIVLADRGQGVRATISRVKPSVQSDKEALEVAFTERISGRAPERRGNGLKFVRSVLLEDGIDLFCQSGSASYSVEGKREQWNGEQSSVPGCMAILCFAVP